MLKNHIQIALRNIRNKRFYSVISFSCYILAFTSFLITINYVLYEKSFDKFHKDSKNIYRLVAHVNKGDGSIDRVALTPPMLPVALKNYYKGVVDFVRVRFVGRNVGYNIVKYGEKEFSELKTAFVDTSFINFFSYKLLKGDSRSALKNPYSVVLSQATAKKYFQDEDPIGKTLIFKNKRNTFNCTVTGIIDHPENSHLDFEILVSLKTYYQTYHLLEEETSWDDYTYFNYIKLAPNTDYKSFEKRFCSYIKKINTYCQRVHIDFEYHLQPLEDIHLSKEKYRWDRVTKLGDQGLVNFLLILSFSILIFCWANILNLSSMVLLNRKKEIGIRLVTGGSKLKIFIQLLIEAFIINLIALLISLALLFVMKYYFNKIFNLNISLYYFNNFRYSLILLCLFIFSIFISNWSSIFIVIKSKTVDVVRRGTNFGGENKGIFYRNFFISLEFILAIIFVVGTFVVSKQYKFMSEYDKGYDSKNIIQIEYPMVNNDSTFYQKMDLFVDEISNNELVESACTSNDIPGLTIQRGNFYTIKSDNSDLNTLTNMHVGYNYFKTYNIKFIAGRPFSKEYGTDKNSIIINKSCLEVFHFKDPEIALITPLYCQNQKLKIIGVIDDYHHESLHKLIEPSVINMVDNFAKPTSVSIKYKEGELQRLLPIITNKWKVFSSENVALDYGILDNILEAKYDNEKRFKNMILFFAIIAIILTLIGILGLSFYDITKRTKEISIRKVLGSSVVSLLRLLYNNILKVLFTSLIIGIPISYYIMDNWLKSYVYRISIPIWIYIVSAILIITVSFLTILYHTMKVALNNPTEGLRSE